MDDGLSIGERIRDFRESRGLTRSAVATRLGVQEKHIEKVENGSSNFSMTTLVSFARAYDASLDYLILGQKPQKYCVAEIKQLAQEILKLADEKTEN